MLQWTSLFNGHCGPSKIPLGSVGEDDLVGDEAINVTVADFVCFRPNFRAENKTPGALRSSRVFHLWSFGFLSCYVCVRKSLQDADRFMYREKSVS